MMGGDAIDREGDRRGGGGGIMLGVMGFNRI
jgi:hypothetical protein